MIDLTEKFLRCPNCNSYSVEGTKLDLREWLGSTFVPVQAHHCTNCSFRYVKYGKFSNNSFKKKFLLITPMLLLMGFLVITLFLSDSQGLPVAANQASVQTEPKTVSNEENPPLIVDDQDLKPVTINNKITEIILKSNPKFGGNWESMEQGLRITRLFDGPLKQAGLEIGDVILSVNDTVLVNESLLLKIRDEIFTGKREQATIKVLRQFDQLNFRLIKAKRETPDNDPQPTAEKERPKKEEAAQYFVKVFEGITIKRRSSHPNSEHRSFRWKFKRQEVTIFRSEKQKVFISGDVTGQKKWAVDDKLIINGTTFDGLLKAYTRVAQYFQEEVMQDPLDITSLVPANRDITLKVELADHGIYWGNTDIFIVIK